MTAADRLEQLAPLLAVFPEMEGWDAPGLRKLVEDELGGIHALEDGSGGVRLLAPRCLLHIMSANTPMAGIQSLVRGLLLGSQNLCKIPGGGLVRFEEFVGSLPSELAEKVAISRTLPPDWQENADAVVVFGTDATVEFFRRQTRPGQIFAGYGDRWSGAVIFEDATLESIPLLARDIGLYDQMGCLSAQIVWLHRSIDPLRYGRCLADALAAFSREEKILPLAEEEKRSVAAWRLSAEWGAAQGEGAYWWSDGEPVWGVAWHGGAEPARLSCLHRHVTLVSFAEMPESGDLSRSLSTLGVWPASKTRMELPPFSGASRICPVGQMQFPSPGWQQDGFPALGRLVRRRSVET